MRQMKLQKEILEIKRQNLEAKWYIYKDMVITNLKLFLRFKNNIEIRNKFLKSIYPFFEYQKAENKLLNKILKNINASNTVLIDSILDDLDLFFQEMYIYYDNVISYFEDELNEEILNNKTIDSLNLLDESKVQEYIKVLKK